MAKKIDAAEGMCSPGRDYNTMSIANTFVLNSCETQHSRIMLGRSLR